MLGKASPACKLCRGQCCTFAPMTRREFKSIRKKYGIPPSSTLIEVTDNGAVMVVTDMESGTCAYLKDSRCSVYEDRPGICRVYGDNDTFPCKLARPLDALRKLEAVDKLKRIMSRPV